MRTAHRFGLVLLVTLLFLSCARAETDDGWAVPTVNADSGETLEVTVTCVGDITFGADPRIPSGRGSQEHYAKLFNAEFGNLLKNTEPCFIRAPFPVFQLFPEYFLLLRSGKRVASLNSSASIIGVG